jgi:hypothetical protein
VYLTLMPLVSSYCHLPKERDEEELLGGDKLDSSANLTICWAAKQSKAVALSRVAAAAAAAATCG